MIAGPISVMVSTGSFSSSEKKDFLESPKHDRVESGFPRDAYPLPYSQYTASHGRPWALAPTFSGCYTRTAEQNLFLQIRVTWTHTNDFVGGIFIGPTASEFISYHVIKWDGSDAPDANSFTGTGSSSPNGLPVVSSVLMADGESGARQENTWSDGVDSAVQNIYYEESYSFAGMLADLTALHNVNLTAWVATPTFQEWKYDSTGAAVAGSFSGFGGNVAGDAHLGCSPADGSPITYCDTRAIAYYITADPATPGMLFYADIVRRNYTDGQLPATVYPSYRIGHIIDSAVQILLPYNLTSFDSLTIEGVGTYHE
jgi:hypothetical protein